MKKLITDRTELDVLEAKENPSSLIHLKGNYNYTDLNRLEEWCDYLEKLFKINGFDIELNIKTKFLTYSELNLTYEQLSSLYYIELKYGYWKMTDIPTYDEINRIRFNIEKLKDKFVTKSILNVRYEDTMNYIQANILEQILSDIDELIPLYKKSLRYCGTFSCGEQTLR